MDAHRHVRGNRHFQNHAVTPPVFWNVADAMFHRFSGRLDGHALSAQGDRPRIRGRNSEQDARQFRAARSDYSSEAYDFTGAQIEINIVNARSFATETPYRKCDARGRSLRRRIKGGNLAADHQLNEDRFVHSRGVLRGDALAVAQDGHPISQSKYLLHPMRDVDHADALCAEIPDDSIKQMHFLLRERGRRLIHNQNARSSSKRACDFDQLLFGHRELAHFRVGINFGTHTL